MTAHPATESTRDIFQRSAWRSRFHGRWVAGASAFVRRRTSGFRLGELGRKMASFGKFGPIPISSGHRYRPCNARGRHHHGAVDAAPRPRHRHFRHSAAGRHLRHLPRPRRLHAASHRHRFAGRANPPGGSHHGRAARRTFPLGGLAHRHRHTPATGLIPIALNPGVTLTGGTLVYYPEQNFNGLTELDPAKMTVFNPNTTGSRSE